MTRPQGAPHHVSLAMLVAEMPAIREKLPFYGVRTREVDDAAQEILIAAWRAVREGRFYVEPGIGLAAAVRRWMYGIAWRQASHFRGSAHQRREIPSGLALEFVADDGRDVDSQLEAREALRAVLDLPPVPREVMLLTGAGMTREETAAAMGSPQGTVASHLRQTRARLAKKLKLGERAR